MRKLLGCFIAFGFLCSVTLAQNVEAGRQSGAAGQKQGEPAGQGDTVRGQVPGQTQQGQAAQGINQSQQGFQQAQAGQQGQFAQRQGSQQAQGQGARSDQEIAACVYLEGHNEVEIAKLGEQKAQSEDVRQFAQQMVRDHSPGVQQMQQKAGGLVSDNSQQRGGQAGQNSEGGLDWVSIKKQIGQQCLTSTRQELSQKSGAEFDQCFMGQQIAAHMKVVDELKVLRNYASQELQQSLDKELQTAQHHLQVAKQIEKQLKGSPSERVSRRPDSNK